MSTNSNTPTIVIMHGDQTGEELLLEGLRVLVPEIGRASCRERV